jgi:hypothetical protein
MVEESCTRSLLHRWVRVLKTRADLQPRALTATSGLGQTSTDKQGHSGEPNRAGGGMGGSCIRFAPKEATNAGLRTGSSAFPTLQIEIDSPD